MSPETPAAAQQETELLQRAKEFWKSLPHCIGYPKCDGDLVGLEHDAPCPFVDAHLSEPSMVEFAAMFARSQLAAAESRLLEATRKREQATAIERKTILTVVDIMLSGESGAAANAVREDYQEFAELIDRFVARLSNGVTPSAPDTTQLPTGVRAEDVREWRKLLLIADSYLSLLRHRGGITTWGELGMTTERELDAVIGKLRRAYEPLPAPPK